MEIDLNKQMNELQLFQKMKRHGEMIAVIICGALLLWAWLGQNYMSDSFWIGLHIAAFLIGGLAKAREGISDTIADKKLNVEMLMIFAAIGSAAIGYWTEGAILIFIFALSGALETYTLNKSYQEISSLMSLQPEEAVLLQNGQEKLVPVSQLHVDDLIFVRASERIPADGVIVRGATSIDESAITGESVPVRKELADEVYAGTVALDGSVTLRISRPADETIFQQIIRMVQSAQEEKPPSQLFIERFEGNYVRAVLIVVAIMMFLPYLWFGWTLSESIYRAMILLVVASPCALVASIMPATLAAISNSARNGVLFKGGVHAENLSQVQAIAFDKTGTLTQGKPVVTDFYMDPAWDKDEILYAVGAIENESTHPLAQAITSYSLTEMNLDSFEVEVEKMSTLSGRGVSALVAGKRWEIGSEALVESDDVSTFHDNAAERLANSGKTIVFAKCDGKIAALFALQDTIRPDAKRAIELLKKQGIYTVMLTGDHEATAQAIAKEVNLDHYVSRCMPEEKVKQIQALRKKYKNVVMVGDGINDAPALASANVGIAMGEGTDVALETADMVLMKNDLTKITSAIRLSRLMTKVVKQNIVFSLMIICILILSNFLQVIDLPLGVIGHEGSTILVILNGLRLLKTSY